MAMVHKYSATAETSNLPMLVKIKKLLLMAAGMKSGSSLKKPSFYLACERSVEQSFFHALKLVKNNCSSVEQ